MNHFLYDADYDARIDVDLVESEEGDPILCQVTVDDGDSNVAAISLTPEHVRRLRLYLQAVERRFR